MFWIALTFLYTCTKSGSGISNNSRLQKVISTNGDSIGYTIFNYDNEQKPIEIIDSANDAKLLCDIVILYDAQGRIAGYSRSDYNSLQFSAVFVYDSYGRIAEQIQHSPNSAFSPYHAYYRYDNKGRLIADSSTVEQTIAKSWLVRFVYDNDDNIRSFQNFIRYENPDSLQNNGEAQLSCDNKANPYHSLGILYYFISNNPFLLSRHNVIQENWNGHSAYFKYEYSSEGLPLKMEEMDNYSRFTVEFFYE
jgi:hypothetical protein